jgi:mono/diheme cytochrome c family protein
MKKILFTILVLVAMSALALAACGGGGSTAGQGSPAVPAEYAGKTNPKSGDAAAIAAGKDLYAANCASCHGATGMGDGPAAAALDPKPKALATEISSIKDDYLLWRISEGGAFAPFNSAMPAWKASLTEDQIWQVIAYLHTLGK